MELAFLSKNQGFVKKFTDILTHALITTNIKSFKLSDQKEISITFHFSLVKVKIHEKKTRETGVQTCQSYEEVVPPNKDKLHKWNVWDLKREAIGLVS